MKHLHLLIGLSLVVAACSDGGDDKIDDTDLDTDTGFIVDTDDDTDGTDDTDDTDLPAGPPEWNEGAWATGWEEFVDCSESGEVTFDAETSNWGGDAALYIAQTRFSGTKWGELHTLDEIDVSDEPDGFSRYARTLETGATAANQTADESTLWVCAPGTPSLDPSDADNFQVTYALAVWDEDADPATDAPADCIVFGQDAAGLIATPDAEGRTPPEWLTDANCRTVE